ncbi:MAG: TRAP transporter small permease [Pseudomonadota bacterium]
MTALAERLSRLLARIAGFAILGSALMITVEVVARKLFATSLIGADEISGYILAITVTWGASLALIRRAHVRIDVVHAQVPAALRSVLDLVALVSLLSVTLLFAWFATRLLRTNIRTGAVSNTPMEVPMWIPQSLWVAGWWVFAAVTLIVIVATVGALIRRDLPAAQKLSGVRGALEEAGEELADAKSRR